jgi:D-alanyl-D-alanine dipeptidase
MRTRIVSALLAPLIASAQNDGSRANEPMVELQKFAPRIVIDLRYATPRNLAKKPIYPKNARAYLRKGVAERLLRAQGWLDSNAPRGIRLKIWDAWRPAWAHKLLWKVLPNGELLRDPSAGGSLHTWGVCVDATLVNSKGAELKMPTDFDIFGPEAKARYVGVDDDIRRNLRLLQSAMTAGGFLAVRDEWWHFCARDWEAYAAVDMSLTGREVPE